MKNSLLILMLPCFLLISGCSITVSTKPDAYPFPSNQVFNVKAGVKANITNFYTKPELVELGGNVSCDLQQFTETARTMVQRELQLKGVGMSANAEKTIMLKMIYPSWLRGVWSMKGKVTLQATLGNGEVITIDSDNQTAGNVMRAFNGATLKAVTGLLQNKVFADYLNI